MPASFLSDAERARLNGFPRAVPPDDLIAFFMLSAADLVALPTTTTGANRLGFALQLCWLRYLGFCPDDVNGAPAAANTYVAEQIAVSPTELAVYGAREQTRTEHAQQVQAHLGYRRTTPEDLASLEDWMAARAMEHDRPTLLLQLACERLRNLKLVRAGLTQLERVVAAARRRAREETVRLLTPLLMPETKKLLDSLLIAEPPSGRTLLSWLRTGATTANPKAILDTLAKVHRLQEWGVDRWDLHALSPNRRHLLAQIARRSTAQSLERLGALRRYPVLLSFLSHALEQVVDETVDLFDKCVSEAYSHAGNELKERRLAAAQSTNEKVVLLREISNVLLDMKVSDIDVRRFVFKRVPRDRLRAAATECETLMRPLDDDYYDLFATRYGYFRQFSPALLETLRFFSSLDDDPLLAAVDLLRRLEKEKKGGPVLPAEDVPTAFIPKKWRPYVLAKDGTIKRRYYELCVLWELRAALRAGDI